MPDDRNPARGPLLAAVDFSPPSQAALLWAARYAKRFELDLVVLHVVHDPASAPGYYERVKKRKKHLTRIEEAAEEMMSKFLDGLRKKHPKLFEDVEPRLVLGIPVTRILEVASEVGAQMIVMGGRGRTRLPAMLIGSKAEKVARLAPITVTIVKSPKSK